MELKRYSISLEERNIKIFDKIAREKERSRNFMIRLIIKQFLEKNKNATTK